MPRPFAFQEARDFDGVDYLSSYGWYHGPLDLVGSEIALAGRASGSFLVRRATGSTLNACTSFILSCVDGRAGVAANEDGPPIRHLTLTKGRGSSVWTVRDDPAARGGGTSASGATVRELLLSLHAGLCQLPVSRPFSDSLIRSTTLEDHAPAQEVEFELLSDSDEE